MVTASWDDTTDEVSGVRVVSDAGRVCALLSPWARAQGNGSVLVQEQGSGSVLEVSWRIGDRRGAVLTFQTAPGGCYTVTPTP